MYGPEKGNPPKEKSQGIYGDGINGACEIRDIHKGRFPANVILSHTPACDDKNCSPDCPVRMLDEQSGTLKPQGNKLGKAVDTKGKGSYFGGGQVNDSNNYNILKT